MHNPSDGEEVPNSSNALEEVIKTDATVKSKKDEFKKKVKDKDTEADEAGELQFNLDEIVTSK